MSRLGDGDITERGSIPPLPPRRGSGIDRSRGIISTLGRLLPRGRSLGRAGTDLLPGNVSVERSLGEQLMHLPATQRDEMVQLHVDLCISSAPKVAQNDANKKILSERILDLFSVDSLSPDEIGKKINHILEDFNTITTQIVERFEQDSDRIKSRFFNTSDAISLSEIALTGGETHLKGQITSFVTLRVSQEAEAGDKDKKIMYKPRDIRIDAFLTGRKGVFRKFNGWLRKNCGNVPHQDSDIYSIRQRVASEEALGTIRHLRGKNDDYGYVECIQDVGDQRLKLTVDGAKDLAWRLGANLGMIQFTSLLDQHQGNAIAVGNKVYLIDTEVIFDPLMVTRSREEQLNGFAFVLAPPDVKKAPLIRFAIGTPLVEGSDEFKAFQEQMRKAFADGHHCVVRYIEQNQKGLFSKLREAGELSVRLVLDPTGNLNQLLLGRREEFQDKLLSIVDKELSKRFLSMGQADVSNPIALNKDLIRKIAGDAYDHHDVPKFNMLLRNEQVVVLMDGMEIFNSYESLLEDYTGWVGLTISEEKKGGKMLKGYIGDPGQGEKLHGPMVVFIRNINKLMSG